MVPIPVWMWPSRGISQLNSRVFAHNQAIVILEQKYSPLATISPAITYPLARWLGHTSGRLVNEIPILLKEKR